MLIVMQKGASADQVRKVCERIEQLGFKPHEIPGLTRVAIGITGNSGPVDSENFRHLDGIFECVPISKPYKLVSREVKPDPTIIEVRGEKVGGGGLAVMAGPCAVESRDQIMRTAEFVAKCGAKWLRGGAYKPRTSPYVFQGLKEEGLRLLEEVRRQFDLRIVTEAKDTDTLAAVAEVADVLQIGARNMQNYSLIEAAGRLRKPVLLKRGMSATLTELFMAAEYLLSMGNYQVMLCERGIRTFETMTRNTFDLSAAVVIKHHSHLPVIADPSHGVGISWAVPPLARSAVVAGADGVMVEVHHEPQCALSDGQQALTFDDFRGLMGDLLSLATWRSQR